MVCYRCGKQFDWGSAQLLGTLSSSAAASLASSSATQPRNATHTAAVQHPAEDSQQQPQETGWATRAVDTSVAAGTRYLGALQPYVYATCTALLDVMDTVVHSVWTIRQHRAFDSIRYHVLDNAPEISEDSVGFVRLLTIILVLCGGWVLIPLSSQPVTMAVDALFGTPFAWLCELYRSFDALIAPSAGSVSGAASVLPPLYAVVWFLQRKALSYRDWYRYEVSKCCLCIFGFDLLSALTGATWMMPACAPLLMCAMRALYVARNDDSPAVQKLLDVALLSFATQLVLPFVHCGSLWDVACSMVAAAWFCLRQINYAAHTWHVGRGWTMLLRRFGIVYYALTTDQRGLFHRDWWSSLNATIREHSPDVLRGVEGLLVAPVCVSLFTSVLLHDNVLGNVVVSLCTISLSCGVAVFATIAVMYDAPSTSTWWRRKLSVALLRMGVVVAVWGLVGIGSAMWDFDAWWLVGLVSNSSSEISADADRTTTRAAAVGGDDMLPQETEWIWSKVVGADAYAATWLFEMVVLMCVAQKKSIPELWRLLWVAVFIILGLIVPVLVAKLIYAVAVSKLLSVCWLTFAAVALHDGLSHVWDHSSWWPESTETVRRNNQLARWRAFAVLWIYNTVFKVPVCLLIFLVDREVVIDGSEVVMGQQGLASKKYMHYTAMRATHLYARLIASLDPRDAGRNLRRFTNAVEMQRFFTDSVNVYGLTATSATTSDELVQAANEPTGHEPWQISALGVTPEAVWLFARMIVHSNRHWLQDNPRAVLCPWIESGETNLEDANMIYTLQVMLGMFLVLAGLLCSSGNSPLVLAVLAVLYFNSPFDMHRRAEREEGARLRNTAGRPHAHHD